MHFDVITIFPKFFESIFSESIISRAIQNSKIDVSIHDLRLWTTDKRRSVDDKPFGGGPGMLMQVEPIYKALKSLNVYPNKESDTKVILTSASGTTWNQSTAQSLSKELQRVVIICGHYEGVDHRVSENLVDLEVSIGDYVLTGGELPASVIIDSISRLIPGVLGNEKSLDEESHQLVKVEGNSLEYPQYTRPSEFVTDEGDTWYVPDILLSGNHAQISAWQKANCK